MKQHLILCETIRKDGCGNARIESCVGTPQTVRCFLIIKNFSGISRPVFLAGLSATCCKRSCEPFGRTLSKGIVLTGSPPRDRTLYKRHLRPPDRNPPTSFASDSCAPRPTDKSCLFFTIWEFRGKGAIRHGRKRLLSCLKFLFQSLLPVTHYHIENL